MGNKYKILSFVGISLVAFLFIQGLPAADAAYISKIEPQEVDNEFDTTIDIYGVDFGVDMKVYLSDIELEDLEVISTNHIRGTVVAGLEEGIHSIRMESASKDIISIVPDAIKVEGEFVKLRALNVREENITGGIKYIVDFNTEARAKLYTGPDSESLTVKVRKPYSERHILPFVFPFQDNYRYYLTQIEAKDDRGNKILLPLQVRKWTTSGVKAEIGDLNFSYPDLNFDFENNSANFTFEANKPIKLKVLKKLFKDGDVEKIEHEGSGSVLMDHYVEMKNLIPNTLYYISLEGEAEDKYGAPEKKSLEFEFYFAETFFMEQQEEELISNDIPENESKTVDEDEMYISIDENEDEAGVEIDNINTEEAEDITDVINFSDFREEDLWAVPYVESLIDAEIVKGEGGSFDPNRLTTRAEMVMMLTRASEISLPDNPTAYFVDVPKTHYVFKPLAVFVEKGYDRGIGDGVFGLDDPITRGDAITMLVKIMGLNVNEDIKKSHFGDISTDSEYLPYVEKALENGWIKIDAEFRLNDAIRRIEVAKIISLAYGLVDTVEEDFEYKVLVDDEALEEDSSEEEVDSSQIKTIVDETDVVNEEVEADSGDVVEENVPVAEEIDEETSTDSMDEEDILDDDISLEELLKLL